MKFQWDPRKAARNLARHGVAFQEASTVFGRGKYFERYKTRSNVVVLDPDVSLAFPNAAVVNEALRGLAAIGSKVPALPNNAHQTKRARSRRRVSS